jgi:ABC-2 type transport system ATP-binding protein
MPLRLPADVALEVAAVSVTIGRSRVLQEVSLTAMRGRILGVLGENGAGKSTLLQLLCGARQPTQGTITVLGARLPWRDRRLLAQLGWVPQETALYEELTVREQLQLFSTVYALPDPAGAITRVVELLALSQVIDTPAGRLSGGMRRRVVIARALLHAPQLLVIDEPTLAVDAETRHLVWSHLRQLRAQGRSVVIATNYLEEARAVCDDVVVLRQGRVVLSESLRTLLERASLVIEIDASPASCALVRSRLAAVDGIVHLQEAASGLVICLREIAREQVETLLVNIPGVERWLSRAPDLHEILHAIGPLP